MKNATLPGARRAASPSSDILDSNDTFVSERPACKQALPDLWTDFLVKRERALASLRLNDGLAANRAFGAFLAAVSS